jgi:hypothetical protein
MRVIKDDGVWPIVTPKHTQAVKQGLIVRKAKTLAGLVQLI